MKASPGIVTVLMLAVAGSLSVVTAAAPAQDFTDEPLPGNAFSVAKADLCLGRSGNIHILAVSDTTIPLLFDSESGYQSFRYFRREPSGFSTPMAIPDSAFHSLVIEAYSVSEILSYATAVDHADRFLFAWSKQRRTMTDISSRRDPPSTIRCLRSTPQGQWQELPLGVRGLNPTLVVDEGDSVHLFWEAPTPVRSDSNFDAYASRIMHAVCPPAAGSFGTPQLIAQGFAPRVVAGRGDTLHLVWFQADSNRAQFFSLRYARFVRGTLSQPQVVSDALPLSRPVPFAVDGAGTAHIAWQRERWSSQGGTALFLTRISPGNVETDSVSQSGLHELPSLAVSSEGSDHLLWPQTEVNSPWVLHYSTNRDAPLFSQVRTFQSVQPLGNLLLFLDRNERPRSVLSTYGVDTAGVKYLRNLQTGPDSVVTLIPSRSDLTWSLNFAVLDQNDRCWVAYRKITLQPLGAPLQETRLFSFVDPTLGLKEQVQAFASFSLEQNYPNPLNPATTIRYSLPQRSRVTLTVFNTLGQKVAELVNGDIEAGSHTVQFNARHLASGVYFYRLQAGGVALARCMAVVK